jgi:hypothetical protein
MTQGEFNYEFNAKIVRTHGKHQWLTHLYLNIGCLSTEALELVLNHIQEDPAHGWEDRTVNRMQSIYLDRTLINS